MNKKLKIIVGQYSSAGIKAQNQDFYGVYIPEGHALSSKGIACAIADGLDKRPGVTWARILKNWGLVFLGNFAGCLTVAVLMAAVYTMGFAAEPNAVGVKIAHIGEDRTLGYAEYGFAGWMTIFIRGMLCNWMVSLGVIGAMMSTTVSGKFIAMWMPIMLFFAMGFEHSVVNMFLFPFAMMMGGDFSITDYFLWNELPVALGNLVGGLALTGLALYTTHVRTGDKKEF